MSGGSMEYLYSRIQDAQFELNTPERVAFKKHLDLVAIACKDIEWVDSGDSSEGKETQSILNCINDLDNVLIKKKVIIDTNISITRENLTPEIRRAIVGLYNDSREIVQEDIWYHIDNGHYEDAIWTIEKLKRFWGDDPVFQEAQTLVDQLITLRDHKEYCIEVVTELFGEETSREYHMDSNNKVITFDTEEEAQKVADTLSNEGEGVFTYIVEYKNY